MGTTNIRARRAWLAFAGTALLFGTGVGQAQTVGTGANVTLTVSVSSGTAPFSYQWMKNGVNIPGATASTYVIPFAQVSINGAVQTTDTYSAKVSNSAGSTSALNSLTTSATPVNDNVANAQTITGTAAVIRGTNVSATKEGGEPLHAGNTGGSSVWWKWMAPQNLFVTVDTNGSAIDTLLGVYTAGYAPVASNDDASATNTASSVSFQAVSGTTYYFGVDGKNGATGPILFQLTTQSDFLAAYSVATMAGAAGVIGSADGTGSAARFRNPAGVAIDSSGNIYVADSANHIIRKMSSGGAVTTLAGSAGSSGSTDGSGSSARFNSPTGVAVDSSGNVYVADSGNDTIRVISSGGVVSTLAGSPGIVGSIDGLGSAARFFHPAGVAVDAAGNIYVADSGNYTIRTVNVGGGVTTIAGIGGVPGYVDGATNAARFNNPSGVAVDSAGNVYVADTGNSVIRKVSPAGTVSTLAGTGGSTGSTDGTGSAARFALPTGVGVDSAGNIYVADTGNSTIRFVTTGGRVSTISGLAGAASSGDGIGSVAHYSSPHGIALDASGNFFVADFGNDTVRKSTFVTGAPVITTQPVSQVGIAGGSVTLSAAGTGFPFAKLQWFKNGTAIPGANNAALTFASLQSSDSGTYTLTASNSSGTATSAAVSLSVTAVIVTQPAPQKVALGGSATLTVVANSSPPVTYQWYHNGVLIPGATSSTYTITSVGPGDYGTYTVVITNSAGQVTSKGATIEMPGTADFDGDGNLDLIWQNMITGERDLWLMNGTTYLGSVSLGNITTDWSIAGAGDFNGDGQTDLLWQNAVTGERLIWLMNGTAFSSSVSLGIVPRQLQIAGTGDFNGDGQADILWQNTLTGEISVWLMNGTTPTSTVSLGFPALTMQAAGAGDFNGDGQPDIVFTNTVTGEVTLWLMNGTTFGSAVSVGFAPAQTAVAGIGDYNGDGQTDIFFTDTATGQRSIWQMNGTTIAATVPLGTVALEWVLNRPLVRHAAADFNADGNSDLVWQNSATGDRVIWLMDGTTYEGGYYFGSVATVWTITALGDMNGDGIPDILWQNSATGERVVWLMDGTTFLSGISLGIITTDWSFAGSGDFSGDGHTDILWQNTVTGERVVWIMNGTAFVSGVSLGIVPTNLQIVGTGDFNRDGKPDILWQNTTTHEVSVWLMNGLTRTATVSLGFATAQQQVVGTGDFNGDGQPDIVLQNTVTGDRSVWLMNGMTFSSSVSVGNIPLQWSIRN